MKYIIYALNMAISMFTIIPLPKHIWEEKAGKYIMTVYPIVGLIIGGMWYVAYVLLNFLDVNPLLMGAILLVIPYILTGFIHLDGFMDVSDALLSRRPREDKLRILKDSTVGAFAVIALALMFLVQFSAIVTVIESGFDPVVLIIIPIISRIISGYIIISRKPIDESYYGKLFKAGTGKWQRVILRIIYFAISIIAYFIGVKYLFMAIIMLIMGVIIVRNCEKELGGVNGDVAGYTLVLTEFVAILTIGLI